MGRLLRSVEARSVWSLLLTTAVVLAAACACGNGPRGEGAASAPTQAVVTEAGRAVEPEAGASGAEPPLGELEGLVASAPEPGTYAAAIDTRGGGCCSRSCGAHSTRASFSLALSADGEATATWERTGCTVLESGEGPRMMPRDPGSPEALCDGEALDPAGGRREVTSLAGGGRLRGRWTRDGEWLRLSLEPEGPGEPLRLACARLRPTRSGPRLAAAVVGCRFIEPGPLTTVGLAVRLSWLEPFLFLDDRPGLVVHETNGGFGDSPQVELVPGRAGR